jgi:hypothetical protein
MCIASLIARREDDHNRRRVVFSAGVEAGDCVVFGVVVVVSVSAALLTF